MAFIKTKEVEIGDWVNTTIVHQCRQGMFEIGTLVEVVSIGERGYSIEDFDGNRIIDIGWTI